ncbi:hypothetical protein [Puniceicoccus vermicola]|uniref:Uncharacterized protein n=1 Tax=Puniceicoccus vermicola TaxID=388746 RepID=A0A7X1E5U0_9BACT|nr:hypothetical protein [Puniceicoccus vermicola]MBC2603501.1 hypothetical protein [Puniceicoccus vermicola]
MKVIRIILGIILPPIIGSLFILVAVASESLKKHTGIGEIFRGAIPGYLFYLTYAFPMMLLPSIIYSFVMEFVGSKIKERKILFLLLSTLMGLGAALFKFGTAEYKFIFAGLLTGLTVGAILQKIHDKERSNCSA